MLGRAPRDVRDRVRHEAERAGFALIERDEHLVPNHARNLALPEVATEYVAFVDNDVIVEAGWLDALVACADETGVAVVGPLQLIGPPEEHAIHLTGGLIEIDESVTPHPVRITHRHQGPHEHEVPEPLVRERCDFAEFHGMLARTEVVRAVGLDEAFLSAREVEDPALKVAAACGTCWFEHAARATFLPPERVRWSEVGFLSHRVGGAGQRRQLRLLRRARRPRPGPPVGLGVRQRRPPGDVSPGPHRPRPPRRPRPGPQGRVRPPPRRATAQPPVGPPPPVTTVVRPITSGASDPAAHPGRLALDVEASTECR